MKKMRKLAGLVLAMIMVLSMGMSTLAATITVNENLTGHNFVAYQIFKGTQSEDKVLGDVEWGTGINPTAFLKALQDDETLGTTFDACTSAADVAKKLGEYTDNSAVAKAVAKVAYECTVEDAEIALSAGETNVSSGYYLVVDVTDTEDKDIAKNAALLQVTDQITIGLKTDKPSVEKKVLENDKTIVNGENDDDYGAGYNDVADYNMGDAVPFKLIGTVPNMDEYDTYKYIFHDTLSAGLTLNESSIKVYVSSDKAGTDKSEIDGFTKTVNGQSFTVSFADLKTVNKVVAGKYILVEYTAVLNQGANVGLPGNENEVYLEYSNNPNQSGEGENNETGRTPEDKVIVFTYELDVTKVNGKDEPLKDAEFVLYRVDKNGTKEYVQVDGNFKVTGWTTDEKSAYTFKTPDNGVFKVIGLDDGTYFLEETKAPSGYNKLKDAIKLEIIATTVNDQHWEANEVPANALTALKLDVTANGTTTTSESNSENKGIVATDVVNNVGATLPETGGMGTTLFYIVGAFLVLGAAVVLVTKRRMNA